MKLVDIEAMCVARLINPGDVVLTALRHEMNGAYREQIQAIRDADTEILDQLQTFPLIQDFDVYQLPRHADSIRRVERFDLCGIIANEDNRVPATIQPVPYAIMERAYRLSPCYVIVPPVSDATGNDTYGSILFVPKPSQSMERGFRITWMPSAEPLVENEQEPRTPTPLHDALAARTLRRILSIGGLQAADPRAAADWIGTQLAFEVTYLNPSGRQAVTSLTRKTALYGSRRY